MSGSTPIGGKLLLKAFRLGAYAKVSILDDDTTYGFSLGLSDDGTRKTHSHK